MREEDTLESQLIKMRKDLDNIKIKQPIGGDGWIVYKIATGNDPDIYIPTADFLTRTYRIIFIPESDGLTAVRLTSFVTADSGVGGDGLMADFDQDNQWIYYLESPSDHTRVRFLAQSTQNGTLSVTEI